MQKPILTVKRTLERIAIHQRYFWYDRFKPKIFCIGLNKTGTTSFHRALHREGMKLGDQVVAERLLSHYMEGDFEPIVRYCKTARAFQDAPFSFPDTYRHLYRAFPDAKFILTLRNSADQWYESLLRFTAQRMGKVPTLADLSESTYCRKGWMYDVHRTLYGEGVEFDNKIVKLEAYNRHAADVQHFFQDKPGRLLVLNMAEKGSFRSFCDFLEIRSTYSDFPWANKTSPSLA